LILELKNLKVLVVGVGGLGCPSAWALAGAGVGELGLMDYDRVELSNLHRQILYSPREVGRPKVEAAREALLARFPQTRVTPLAETMDAKTLEKYLPRYDLVIDGLDRLEKKFFLNDWCVRTGKPYVHAGVVRFEGQVLAVEPGKSACLRCLLPKIPPPFAMPTCREAGVLGAFSQAIGYLAAEEALRLARGRPTPRLWKVELPGFKFRSLVPERRADCDACGRGKVAELSAAACGAEG